MILVTSAAGKTGRAIIRALAQSGTGVRAWVYRREQSQIVHAAGAQEAFIGDLRQSSDYLQAVEGIQAVYHICPNVSPYEVQFGRVAIAACIHHGVKRFVYHSVLHPQTKDMPHHWAKLQVEDLLFQSGLEYTILQPAAYMQNLWGYWKEISEERVFRVPYPVSTRISMVDLEDVAQVAATVLSDRKHVGATYELGGPEHLSQLEVAGILTSELGFEVVAQEESITEWSVRMQGSGLGDYQRSMLIKMFKYYGDYGFQGNPVILQHLLQRQPTTLRTFIQRKLAR